MKIKVKGHVKGRRIEYRTGARIVRAATQSDNTNCWGFALFSKRDKRDKKWANVDPGWDKVILEDGFNFWLHEQVIPCIRQTINCGIKCYISITTTINDPDFPFALRGSARSLSLELLLLMFQCRRWHCRSIAVWMRVDWTETPFWSRTKASITPKRLHTAIN